MLDSLGDRQKEYEELQSHKLMRGVPVVVRIDGVGFSRFTKGLDKPYHQKLTELMEKTTLFLLLDTVADFAYTQSDEISLTWRAYTAKEELIFGGRLQKMQSRLAAQATSFFMNNVSTHLPKEYANKLPHFDARAWNVPNSIEGANYFIWRERDAVRNSITCAAQTVYSHKELMNKNSSEKNEMLFQKGINWNDYPAFFKRGTWYQRYKVTRPYTADEMKVLPEKHQAKTTPGLTVERAEVRKGLEQMTKLSNLPGVIYCGSSPATKEEA